HLHADRLAGWRATGEFEEGNLAGAGRRRNIGAHLVDDLLQPAHVGAARVQGYRDLTVLVAVQRLDVGELDAGQRGHRARLAFTQVRADALLDNHGLAQRVLDR